MAHVSSDVFDRIALLRYANPPQALVTAKGAAELADAIEACLADDCVRAVVLAGDGPGTFLRHADVAQIARASDAVASGRIGIEAFLGTPFWRLGRLLDQATKPVIAAIEGACMGGGFEIALACTIRIASRSVSEIGLPEIRIDIFPGAGGTRRLTRIIGAHRARLFMLQGRIVDAATAHAMDLVDEVADDAVARSIEVARELAGRAPAAVRAIMTATRVSDDVDSIDTDMMAFGELLRDAPSSGERLHRFVADGRDLSELD